MFIAASSITAKNWKQSRYPSMGKWLNKLVHAYHGKLLSKKKKERTMEAHNNVNESPENYAMKNQSQIDTVWFHLYNILEVIKLQLTLKQHGFELQGSTNTQIFLNKYILQYYMILSWLNPRMWNCSYGGPTVKLYVVFQLLWDAQQPNPHIVQGSTV